MPARLRDAQGLRVLAERDRACARHRRKHSRETYRLRHQTLQFFHRRAHRTLGSRPSPAQEGQTVSNVYSLPPQKRSLDEASDWLAKLDRGLSGAEEQELKTWLSQHPENRRALLRLASLWDKMDSLSLLTELSPPARERSHRSYMYPAIAASLAILVVAGWLVHRSSDWLGTPAGRIETVASVYETAIGERSTVRLPDQ